MTTLRGMKIKAGIAQGKAEARLFLVICRGAKIPEPVQEYRFAHPEHGFAFDFAWPEYRVALEKEGGLFGGGAHARPMGIGRDINKHNEAILRGWMVLRCIPGDRDAIRYRKNSKGDKTATIEFYVPALLNFSMIRILNAAFEARRKVPPIDADTPVPPLCGVSGAAEPGGTLFAKAEP